MSFVGVVKMAAEGGEAKKITISIGQKFAGWPLDFPAADRNPAGCAKNPDFYRNTPNCTAKRAVPN